MKKVIGFIILLIISSVTIQPAYAQSQCGRFLLEGCIGNCGESFLVTYQVFKDGAYCFSTVNNSLCPNTGAKVAIYLNEDLIFNDDMTDGAFSEINAKKDDTITIEAMLFPTGLEIACIWLGELHFQLGQSTN
ncbi:MAG: hypothetical protein GY874_08850 [Desulfobacteraceae bacterium]|nr:hypothetical protein [Desulfobacteraceae bacterium]